MIYVTNSKMDFFQQVHLGQDAKIKAYLDRFGVDELAEVTNYISRNPKCVDIVSKDGVLCTVSFVDNSYSSFFCSTNSLLSITQQFITDYSC